MKKTLTDEDFIAAYLELGTVKLAEELKINVRSVAARRARIEKRYQLGMGALLSPRFNEGIPLPAPLLGPTVPRLIPEFHQSYPSRLLYDIPDGVILVGSDAHYWPGRRSTAHRAFVYFARELQAVCTLLNGDVFDGASINRHPPLGWVKLPTVREEREAVEERLTEIRDAAPEATRIWTRGNHDARFEMRLAANVPEYEGVPGFYLKDHFPEWLHCMSAWINEDTVIKHRFKGGIHATHANTVMAGKNIVTGHLHSLKVTPFTDYNGTRFGVDTGTLENPVGPHTDYTEDNPLNHRSGFAVLTFHNKKLLWPEIVAVVDENHVQFRGTIFRV